MENDNQNAPKENPAKNPSPVPGDNASDKRPKSDPDQAVERENREPDTNNQQGGSSKEGADFESPGDDPA